MTDFAFDDGDEVDWPLDHPLGRKADQLEEDMHCPICTDFYDNPHLLITCGHSFCSICIRKHFDAKLNPTNSGICPACRKKSQSADLVKNVALAAVVDRYKALREDVFQLLQNSLRVPKLKEDPPESSSSSSGVPNHRNSRTDISAPVVVAEEKAMNPNAHRGAPIVSRIPQFNSHGANLQKIKNHIEHVTKNSKVRLRMDGDKETLDKRLRELIHQINAQVDHHNPLTLDEVIFKVNREEKLFEQEQYRAKMTSRSNKVRAYIYCIKHDINLLFQLHRMLITLTSLFKKLWILRSES